MHITKMSDLNLKGKRVLVREDFNVPLDNGRITSDTRIQAALPTIKALCEQQATIILMSHLGRPTEGQFEQPFSLEPVAQRLQALLNKEVKLVRDWQNDLPVTDGDIILLENVRFNIGEKANDAVLAKKLASLADVFVMDAFATAHRAQASTEGVAHFAPQVCAGPLLCAELNALSQALEQPSSPLVAIVGGAKVSSKLTLLENLLPKVDQLIVGGGIANTFLLAAGHNIGCSLHEKDLVPAAQKLLSLASSKNIDIPLPVDVVTAKDFNQTSAGEIKTLSEITDDDMILDIGPQTAQQFAKRLTQAGTILWNGPVGVFEKPQFSDGTKTLSLAIAQSNAFSIAGGGDTLAAIDRFGVKNAISYISTGGGAFLEFVEGKTLPAIAILQQRAKD